MSARAIPDGATFARVGRIESPEFRRTPVRTPQGMNSSAAPHGIAITGDGRKVCVGLENADAPGMVVIDVASRTVARQIDLLLQGGHYLAIQPGTGKWYYPHRDDDHVVVLDTKTDRVTKVVAVKGGPVGVAFRPNGEVWLHEDGDGSVTVLDASDAVVAVIPTGGTGAGLMAVSPEGRYAASTHGGTQDVAIIDCERRAVVATVPLGRGPGFPLFAPDSSRLYVMNSDSGDVAVIDMQTRAVTARHQVGTHPFGGAEGALIPAGPGPGPAPPRRHVEWCGMHRASDHAAAFVAATVAALAGNALLQLALDAVRVSGYGGGAPWWVTAELIERGRWVAFAVILYAAAPGLLDADGSTAAAASPDRPGAWRAVGLAVLVVPLLWILATWLVSALRFTLLGSWGTEGQVFLSPGYYRGLALGYVPWLMGGGVVLGVRGHL